MAKARAARIALATALVALVTAGAIVVTPAAGATLSPASTSEALAWRDPGPVDVDLFSVSCPDGACLALGSYETNADPDDTTYAYVMEARSASGAWTSVPFPAGLAEPIAVSCTAPETCVLIGTGTGGVLAFTQSGATWTSTVLTAPVGWSVDDVTSISCVAQSCQAVGALSNESTHDIDPAVWTLSGGTWTVTVLPSPASSFYGLTGISCVDASDCTAIGLDVVSTKSLIVAVDAGGTWTTNVVALPSTYGTQLLGVPSISCWAAGSCEGVAAGSSAIALAVSGTGLTFSSLPPVDGKSVVTLASIDCTAAASCLAVGLTGQFLMVTATLSGSSWTTSQLVEPGSNAFLSALSCWAAGQCVAVGEADLAYGLSLDGTTWSVDTPIVGGPPQAGLTSVSCPASAFCVAVGQFYDDTGDSRAVMETWNGARWSATTPPASAGQPPWLSDVSCPQVGRCVAVGGGLLDTLAGGAWTPTAVAPTTGASSPNVSSVSCTSAASCVAVGWETRAGKLAPLVEVLATGTWHASVAPIHASTLGSISCWAALRCVALGQAATAGGNSVTRAELLDDARWTTAGLPLPKGTVQPSLDSVACSSARSCLIVGSYYAGANAATPSAILESGPAAGPWRATAWRGVVGGLFSVGCNRSMRCVAIGEPPTYSPHQYDPGEPILYVRTTAGRWSRTHVAVPSGQDWITLAAGTCPPSGSCVAVGTGHIYVDSDQPAVVTAP